MVKNSLYTSNLQDESGLVARTSLPPRTLIPMSHSMPGMVMKGLVEIRWSTKFDLASCQLIQFLTIGIRALSLSSFLSPLILRLQSHPPAQIIVSRTQSLPAHCPPPTCSSHAPKPPIPSYHSPRPTRSFSILLHSSLPGSHPTY